MDNRPLTGQRVTIVGGGLVGLASAHYLNGLGAEVTVFEREEVGGGAARGNGGLISTTNAGPLPAPGVVSDALRHLFSPTSAFYVAPSAALRMTPYLLGFARRANAKQFRIGQQRMDLLTQHTTRLFRELRDQGIGTSMRELGFVRCFSSRRTADADREAFSVALRRGFTPDAGPVLDRQELLQEEPALGSDVQAGYLLPGERFADPATFVDEMRDSLTSRGVRFEVRADIDDAGEEKGVPWVASRGQRHESDRLVIAAGARSNPLARKFGVNARIAPGKGYSFCLTPEQVPSRVLYLSDAHLAISPLPDGRVRVAGTMEFDGGFDRLSRRRLEALKTASHGSITGVDWNKVEDEWVGPRPMTLDGLPLIGAVSPSGNTVLASGHNMLGFALAPATGVLVADILTGRGQERQPELDAFNPYRFNFRRRN
jgi:D-amino-acid dehydrogenase